MACILAGVIVVAEGATVKDLDSLKNRKLPFVIAGETTLPGPRVLLYRAEETAFTDSTVTNTGTQFVTIGQRVAEALTRAFQSGEPLVSGPFAATHYCEESDGSALVDISKEIFRSNEIVNSPIIHDIAARL